MNIQGTLQGMSEADIANYLANTPGFFERHAELLSSVQLTSPHGQRAVSLQERQMEMLRDTLLELRIVEMIRHGQENITIADRLHRTTRRLLVTEDPEMLPGRSVETLKHEFMIPQAALRLWNIGPVYDNLAFAQEVNDDAKSFSASLTQPYCGVNAGFDATRYSAEMGTEFLMRMAEVTSAALSRLRLTA